MTTLYVISSLSVRLLKTRITAFFDTAKKKPMMIHSLYYLSIKIYQKKVAYVAYHENLNKASNKHSLQSLGHFYANAEY